MALSEERREYLKEYQKNKLKRIPLDVSREKYDAIKTVADSVGESVNGYIKKAIDDRMERDGFATNPHTYSTKVQTLKEAARTTKSIKTIREQSNLAPTLKELSRNKQPAQTLSQIAAAAEPQNEPQNEPQSTSHKTDLPDYLTPDVLSHIDARRYLSGDMAYQLEIGSIIGMDNISSLADYLKQQIK